MIPILLAVFGLVLFVAEVVAIVCVWRSRRTESSLPHRGALKLVAGVAGVALAAFSLAFPTAIGYTLDSPTGPARVIGVPFLVAVFDSQGRDYVGPLTLPAAIANAAVWLILPWTVLAAYAWIHQRSRRGA